MKADDELVKRIFKKLKTESSEPEAISSAIDKILEPRLNKYSTTGKAYITDNIMHQLLGEAALQEVEGLADLPTKESYEKIREASNKGLTDLKKATNVSSKINIKDLSKHKAQGRQSPASGIEIDKSLDSNDLSLKQLGIGTFLHENSHAIDDVTKRIAQLEEELYRREEPDYKLKKFRKLSDPNYKPSFLEKMNDEDLMKYYSQIKESFVNYVKNNPDKLQKSISSPGMLNFQSVEVPKNLSSEFYDLKPTQLQNMYSGAGHWFRRNFPFDSLKNVLKSGVKGIKSVGVGTIPAIALGAAAAYSPDTKAGTVLKTTQKALDEGDPLSAIFPPEAGEGEEEEIKKMYEEAKQKRFGKLKQTLK